MAINPMAINYEKVYWKLHHISNLLLEIKLVWKEELKKPEGFFPRLAAAYQAWGKAQPTWKEIQKILLSIMPNRGAKLLTINFKKADLALQNPETIPIYHPHVGVSTPNFRGIPPYYR